MLVVNTVKQSGYPVTMQTGVEIENLLTEGLKTTRCPDELKIAAMHASAAIIVNKQLPEILPRTDKLQFSNSQADWMMSLNIPGMENVLHGKK